MCCITPELISTLHSDYIDWCKTEEKTKKIECQYNNTDLKIIFNRGRWIKLSGFPLPQLIENTINIAPNDEAIIKFFRSSLISIDMDNDSYSFPHQMQYTFKIRFFTDEASIEQELAKENIAIASQESIFSACNII